jgi:hypothetical protein
MVETIPSNQSICQSTKSNENISILVHHIWEYVFNVILGFLVFISMLRIMSALDYNKRMTALADMLYHGGGEICRISILLFIGLVGFAKHWRCSHHMVETIPSNQSICQSTKSNENISILVHHAPKKKVSQ